MVFNTANALRRSGRREPGGSLMVFGAADLARELERLTDAEIVSSPVGFVSQYARDP